MKRGLKIILIIIILALIILIATGLYFYNFYVFKTLKACIKQQENDLLISCKNKNDCVKFFIDNSEPVKKIISETPDFLKPRILEGLNKSLSCNNTCKFKEIYGFGFGNQENVDSCKPEEVEIKYEIKGKDALKLLRYLKTKDS
jgi:hypothetical protein